MAEKTRTCKGDHTSHSCVLSSKEMSDEIKRITNKPKFLCYNCGHTANSEKNLCHPISDVPIPAQFDREEAESEPQLAKSEPWTGPQVTADSFLDQAPIMQPVGASAQLPEDMLGIDTPESRNEDLPTQVESPWKEYLSEPVAPKPVSEAQASSETTASPEHPLSADTRMVEFWEKALGNRSPAVHKQVVQQLKRLTGRDYE